MAFTQLSSDLNIIQGLPDSPESSAGYTATVLKTTFDEAGNTIKLYINSTLLPELESTTDGSSGANKIGATAFDTITSENVQDQLEEINAKIVATTGDVTGPASATDSGLVQFDGTTGKQVKGGITIEEDTLSDPGDNVTIPTTKAVRSAISAAGGGDFSGPASAVDENIIVFDGTGGKTGKDSGVGVSDLMQDVSDDTTPQLGGELDTNGKIIMHTIYDNSDAGSALTIDWSNGQMQKVNMDQASTFTFTAPTKPSAFILEITYDGDYGVTFPSTVVWSGGSAPTLTKTSGRTDLLTFVWNGTYYLAGYNLNYTTP